MSSTPLISCSSGVATVWATVSADAPGYDAVTFTVGGTISGYWATGRIANAPKPNAITKMLRTVAKRGRSMKKWVRRMSWTQGLNRDDFSARLRNEGSTLRDRSLGSCSSLHLRRRRNGWRHPVALLLLRVARAEYRR